MHVYKSSLGADGCPCCGRQNCQALRSHVLDLELRISALQEENARLIESANTFADLADRLNYQLQNGATAAVRRASDRRCTPLVDWSWARITRASWRFEHGDGPPGAGRWDVTSDASASIPTPVPPHPYAALLLPAIVVPSINSAASVVRQVWRDYDQW